MRKVLDIHNTMLRTKKMYGAADLVVLQLVAKWTDLDIREFHGEEVLAGWMGRQVVVNIGGAVVPITAVVGPGVVADPETMTMESFGLEKLGPGVWAIDPAIHRKGGLHAYILLVEVPDPAPFEPRRLEVVR
jgi:hypothetical protein